MSLGKGVKGVSDTPALKSERFKYKFYWDSRANRGRGAYVQELKVTRRR